MLIRAGSIVSAGLGRLVDCRSRKESNFQIERVLVLHTGVGNLDATVFHVLYLVPF